MPGSISRFNLWRALPIGMGIGLKNLERLERYDSISSPSVQFNSNTRVIWLVKTRVNNHLGYEKRAKEVNNCG